MRRLRLLLAFAAVPLVAAACTGADAKKAQDLLAQSRVAAQSVRSESFTMKMNIDAVGKTAEVDAQGGMVLRGTGTGDFYATMSTNAPGTAPIGVVMVKRGNLLRMTMNGRSRTVPMPAGLKPAAAAGFDVNALTPYVKNVSVSTLDVNGRTEDEVVGTIDGDALLANLPGVSKGVFSNLGASLGDIKVSLFIPRDTHLVETALIDLTMHVAKQSAHMSMSFAVTGVNQPVTFPRS